MNRRVFLSIFVTLLAVVVVAAVGFYAYSWGLAQGALQNAQIVVPEAGQGAAPVYPYYAMPYHFGRWGWGWGGAFGFVQCLVPVLGFFLLFALLRAVIWRPWGHRWGWGGPSGWGPGHGVPSMFAEWHRRAHAGEGGQAPPEA